MFEITWGGYNWDGYKGRFWDTGTVSFTDLSVVHT